MHFFPENTLEKLNFSDVQQLLLGKCIGTLGQSYIAQQVFFENKQALEYQLNIIHQIKHWLESGHQFPNQGFKQLSFIEKINIENYYIEIENFIQLYHCLKTASYIKKSFLKADEILYSNIIEVVNTIEIPENLIQTIQQTILIEQAIVNEKISEKLQQLKKKQATVQQQIYTSFKKIVQHYKQKKYLHETDESIRNDRKVLAVLSEKKRMVKGMMVDESSNGSIIFMEPEETLQLNNELMALKLEEKREIEKILMELGNTIRPFQQTIKKIQLFLAQFDAWQAKAYFAIEHQCVLPKLSEENIIYLKNFRNILLERHLNLKKGNQKIVKNTLHLDANQRILVISGPNAGGKSVVLKSVGLIQCMLQFGMLVPVEEGSIMSIFQQLFIDIGDEQSIENDVSTYSAHLLKMKYCIEKATQNTLVLIDEIGVGTDPTLGGAMAEAILSVLHEKQIFGIITTHFNNLKIVAAQTQGMQSAAMAFDKKALNPKYELLIGQPGSSFTFEIAEKIGLPKTVVNLAQQKIGENQKALDQTLNDVQNEKHFIKGLRKNVQQKEVQLNNIIHDYEKLKKELEKNKKQLQKAYEEKLLQLYNEQSKALENAMRKWRESQNKKEDFKLIRNEIDEQRVKIERQISETQNHVKTNDTIKIGSKVNLIGGTEVGKIVSINSKKALVAFGNFKTTVGINQLEIFNDKPEQKVFKIEKSSRRIIEKSVFETTLDIRGMLVEEVQQALENYFDKAMMYSFGQIKILHGRGTGALRNYVQQFLKKYPYVKKYYFEKEEFGGNGITIVELS